MTQSPDAPKPKDDAKTDKESQTTAAEQDELDDDGWGEDEPANKEQAEKRASALATAR